MKYKLIIFCFLAIVLFNGCSPLGPRFTVAKFETSDNLTFKAEGVFTNPSDGGAVKVCFPDELCYKPKESFQLASILKKKMKSYTIVIQKLDRDDTTIIKEEKHESVNELFSSYSSFIKSKQKVIATIVFNEPVQEDFVLMFSDQTL